MGKRVLVGNLVTHYEKHGLGLPTVAYAVTKEHARKIARAFKRKGHDVELLFGIGDTSLSERERILGRLDAGASVIVATVGVLAEGWDCPAAKCCIMARPTRSRLLHIQILGRFLRKSKRVPIILDHAGNTVAHGLPQQHREYTLDAGRNKGGGKAPSKECPECGALCVAGAAECSECGHEFKIEREPRRVDGFLVEVKPTKAEIDSVRAHTEQAAAASGLSKKWVDAVMKRRFGIAV